MTKEKTIPIVEAVEKGWIRFKSKTSVGIVYLELDRIEKDEGRVYVTNLCRPESGVLWTPFNREVSVLNKEDEKNLKLLTQENRGRKSETKKGGANAKPRKKRGGDNIQRPVKRRKTRRRSKAKKTSKRKSR